MGHDVAVPYPLSSRTKGHLAEAIAARYTHTNMETLFHKAGAEDWIVEGANKEAKALGLLTNMAGDGSKEAAAAGLELLRLVLAEGKAAAYGQEAPWYPALRDAAQADGWEFDEQHDELVPTVPGISVANEITWIEAELERRGWTEPAGHYRQAVANFADGNWAAANSQLRTFFEALIRTVAGNQEAKGNGQVQKGFDDLDARDDLLVEGEAAFGKAAWRLMHEGGSHPGLSDQDTSRFRLLMLTGYARLLLSRLSD